MTAKELRAIAKVMDECGIAFIKTKDLEMHKTSFAPIKTEAPLVPFHVERSAVPVDALQPDKDEIEHKLVELTSVMKLSDMELVDSLFPDHTEQSEAV